MDSSPVDVYASLRDLRSRTDSVLVGYSGGKDSATVLHLCTRGAPGIPPFKHVEAFFLYGVPGLAYIDRMLDTARRFFGVEIHQYPHPDYTAWIRFGTYRHAPDPTVRKLKFPDVWRLVRAETGFDWIATGERRTDSIWRDAMIRKSGAVDVKLQRAFPIAYWSKFETLRYFKLHKLPRSPDAGVSGTLTNLQGNSLYLLRERYPEDYQRVLAIFPFAEANVFRYEQRLKQAMIDAGLEIPK